MRFARPMTPCDVSFSSALAAGALLALSAVAGLHAQEAQTPAPAPAAGTETAAVQPLRPQFFPGKVYRYVTDTSVNMKVPRPQGQAADERGVLMEHHSRLQVSPRAGAEGVSIQAGTERLKIEIAGGDEKIRYDSGDSAAPATNKAKVLARHFGGATQRTLAMDLDGAGKIISAKEGGGGGSATPFPGLPQFGPDQLKQLVAGMVQGFPPDPVKPGEEWVQKGKRSLDQFGEIDFEIAYRYAGDEDFEGASCARIDYRGTIKGDVALQGSAPGLSGGKLGFEGTELTGRMMFDKLRKAVRLSEQNVKIAVDAPTPSGTIRLTMNQRIVSKLVSLQDK